MLCMLLKLKSLPSFVLLAEVCPWYITDNFRHKMTEYDIILLFIIWELVIEIFGHNSTQLWVQAHNKHTLGFLIFAIFRNILISKMNIFFYMFGQTKTCSLILYKMLKQSRSLPKGSSVLSRLLVSPTNFRLGYPCQGQNNAPGVFEVCFS
jgi:hypothetical protein